MRIVSQRGTAAVELAIVLIPLSLLVFGLAEFGRAIYQYNTIAKGARDATRYLSQYSPGDAAYIAAARNLVVCGTTSACTEESALVPGLTTAMVSVCDRVSCPDTHALQTVPAIAGGGSLGQVNLVTVSVSGYTFNSVVPLIVPTVSFGPISATMVQIL
jgi:Flp pilus assembly protein TadG